MKRIYLLVLSILVFLFTSCSKQEISIIPKPLSMLIGEGNFTISKSTVLCYNKEDSAAAKGSSYLTDLLKKKGISTISQIFFTEEIKSGYILFTSAGASDTLGEEGYELAVNNNCIVIKAKKEAGFFYAIQTLRQLMPSGFEKEGAKFSKLVIPALAIIDKPRFPWRGMNFDCCRHFMSKDFVKRYIDLLAYYKMNIFHWHLTEDQGWRIEIKKYPKLTSIGAWRTEADGKVYGGFYTQEDIKEVVAYAAERFVNIVPEIEMPGHSTAALASYPQFSCTGGPFKVETNWGVFKDIYCAGNDSTFIFMQNVLDEVVNLFPFKYIHVGGDEAPKYRWENCPKCQKRIIKEKLANEEELQKYFISTIARYLETKNRKIIGWDEILEGGIPDLATVQSWRGYDGAKTAALAGVNAIVSPTSHCYFDYPVESVDLEKVFSFEPIPSGLTLDQQKHIIGGECNMWSEQAPQELVDAKMFPRTLAMAEVLWSSPSKRDFKEFHTRVQNQYGRLDDLGVMYGPEQGSIKILNKNVLDFHLMEIEILKGQSNLDIYYTLDGSMPTRYSKHYRKKFRIDETTVVRAAAFKGEKMVGAVSCQKFVLNLSTGKPIKLSYQPADKYTGGGLSALVDGRKGTDRFNDGIWQAVQGQKMEVVIDLGSEQEIHSITTGFLQSNPSWIFLPSNVHYLFSSDGLNFSSAAIVISKIQPEAEGIIITDFSADFENVKARYIKMVATSIGLCPTWHAAEGSPSWLFADEIEVE
jgi:hexosaminidase